MAATRAPRDWLAAVQGHVARGELAAAATLLRQALAEHPTSVDLRRAEAGVLQRTGRGDEAEAALQSLLREHPADVASAFALADILKDRGRMAAAAATLRACLADAANRGDADTAIAAIEFLDDCGRKADAAAIVATAIDADPRDARLHAYAGMLEIQLGHFIEAREHYLFALEHDDRAWDWHAAGGLSSSQRYADRHHPDFARFRAQLDLSALSEPVRAELEFALGKACDDIGDYVEASGHFRAANASAHRSTGWSRKAWRRFAEARLAAPPFTHRLAPRRGFTPVFIVGMPRTGTTLLAGLLARHPEVCNRGELPWIAKIAERLWRSSDPAPRDLESAAAIYAMQARQDDAGDARWIIDKQPLNFRHLDLMLAMFPDARVIQCRRSERDTALSLWMQHFREDVQGYSYDFRDIALVMRDCERLMARSRQRHPDAIRAVSYEELVTRPRAVVAALAEWIGLPPAADASPPTVATSSISTASLWQARQPIHTQSIGRWRHYVAHVPELQRFADAPSSSTHASTW